MQPTIIHTAVEQSLKNTLFAPGMQQPTLEDLLLASDRLIADGMNIVHKAMHDSDSEPRDRIQAVNASIGIAKYLYQRKRDNELANDGQISIVINEGTHGAD